jgi:antitoxin component YwqK of YwqJK toxin-antitoxin module
MRIFIITIFAFFSYSLSFAQNDTINRIDEQNQKQGYWATYSEDSLKILEEGFYKDNVRVGVWKQYLEDGTISSEITYVDDEPNGYAKIYYPNGNIAEEGIWRSDVWIGEYKAYHQNGQLIYKWNFNEQGLRTGKQEYFHDNGAVMISGNWDKGNESGVVTRFDEKGEVILEQTYNNGIINPELTVEYVKDENPIETEIKQIPVLESEKDTIVRKDLELFNGTGDQKLYDTKHRLTQDGYFENGRLMKGKKYYYNSESEIVKVEIYNQGKLYKAEYPKEDKN